VIDGNSTRRLLNQVKVVFLQKEAHIHLRLLPLFDSAGDSCAAFQAWRKCSNISFKCWSVHDASTTKVLSNSLLYMHPQQRRHETNLRDGSMCRERVVYTCPHHQQPVSKNRHLDLLLLSSSSLPLLLPPTCKTSLQLKGMYAHVVDWLLGQTYHLIWWCPAALSCSPISFPAACITNWEIFGWGTSPCKRYHFPFAKF
jgi:hypothetical protein